MKILSNELSLFITSIEGKQKYIGLTPLHCAECLKPIQGVCKHFFVWGNKKKYNHSVWLCLKHCQRLPGRFAVGARVVESVWAYATDELPLGARPVIPSKPVIVSGRGAPSVFDVERVEGKVNDGTVLAGRKSFWGSNDVERLRCLADERVRELDRPLNDVRLEVILEGHKGGVPLISESKRKLLEGKKMIVCPSHPASVVSGVDGLHVVTSLPLVDCGNYLFRCAEGCVVCPAHGIIKKGGAK